MGARSLPVPTLFAALCLLRPPAPPATRVRGPSGDPPPCSVANSAPRQEREALPALRRGDLQEWRLLAHALRPVRRVRRVQLLPRLRWAAGCVCLRMAVSSHGPHRPPSHHTFRTMWLRTWWTHAADHTAPPLSTPSFTITSPALPSPRPLSRRPLRPAVLLALHASPERLPRLVRTRTHVCRVRVQGRADAVAPRSAWDHLHSYPPSLVLQTRTQPTPRVLPLAPPLAPPAGCNAESPVAHVFAHGCWGNSTAVRAVTRAPFVIAGAAVVLAVGATAAVAVAVSFPFAAGARAYRRRKNERMRALRLQELYGTRGTLKPPFTISRPIPPNGAQQRGFLLSDSRSTRSRRPSLQTRRFVRPL